MSHFKMILFVLGMSFGLVYAEENTESTVEQDIIATLANNSESFTEAESIPAPIMIKKAPEPLVIGLALGGGAAKGFAHIGVIKALEENHIKAQVITGTSAGSLVGSLYAYGYTPEQLQRISYQMDELLSCPIPFFQANNFFHRWYLII